MSAYQNPERVRRRNGQGQYQDTEPFKYIPLSLSVSLVLNDISTATMVVSLDDDELPELAEFIRVFTPNADEGLFRVTGIEDDIGMRTRTVSMEHMFGILKDGMIFDKVEPKDITGNPSATTCTVQQALTYILGQQPIAYWLVGDCSDYSGISHAYTFEDTNLYDALTTVLESLTDAMVTFGYNGNERRLNIVQKPNRRNSDDIAVLRLSRNIGTVSNSVDTSDMYTKLYPVGYNGLEVSGKYRTKNTSIYGTICRTESNEDIEDETQLAAWATALLEKNAKPKFTVTVTGREISNDTGESVDELRVGRRCVVPIKWYNSKAPITMDEAITEVNWSDLVKDQETVNVTISNGHRDVATVIGELKKESRGGGRSAKKKGDEADSYIKTGSNATLASLTTTGVIDAGGNVTAGNITLYKASGMVSCTSLKFGNKSVLAPTTAGNMATEPWVTSQGYYKSGSNASFGTVSTTGNVTIGENIGLYGASGIVSCRSLQFGDLGVLAPTMAGSMATEPWVTSQGYYKSGSNASFGTVSTTGNVTIGENIVLYGASGMVSCNSLNFGNKSVLAPTTAGNMATEPWVSNQGYYKSGDSPSFGNITATGNITASSGTGTFNVVSVNGSVVAGGLISTESYVSAASLTLGGTNYTNADGNNPIATHGWVGSQGYATTTWVGNQGYYKSGDDASFNIISTNGSIVSGGLVSATTTVSAPTIAASTTMTVGGNAVATQAWVNSQGFITSTGTTTFSGNVNVGTTIKLYASSGIVQCTSLKVNGKTLTAPDTGGTLATEAYVQEYVANHLKKHRHQISTDTSYVSSHQHTVQSYSNYTGDVEP